jgi:hypothetical protein
LRTPNADGDHGYYMVETHDGVFEPGQETARYVTLADMCKSKGRSEQPVNERRRSGGAREQKSSA